MIFVKLIFMLIALTIVFLVVGPGTTNDGFGIITCCLAGYGTGDIVGKIGNTLFGEES